MGTEQRKFRRSDDRIIAGVCAGLAEPLDINVVLVRLAYVALSLFSAGFPGLLLYLLCWIIVPPKNSNQ